MGTRSLTVFQKSNGEEIVVMYRQYDGYPTGMGKDLQDFLKGFTIVNGYSETNKIANGMGCLSAQVIAELKDGCGNIYLYPAGTRDVWEDYIYTLYPEKNDGTGKVMIKCITPAWDKYPEKVIYEGLLDNWDIKEEE